jgi:hypothetical protein
MGGSRKERQKRKEMGRTKRGEHEGIERGKQVEREKREG